MKKRIIIETDNNIEMKEQYDKKLINNKFIEWPRCRL